MLEILTLAAKQLQQFPSFPDKQFMYKFPAITQAHREQEAKLLHL